MHPFPLFAITVLVTLYGLAWHDKPAQEPVRKRRASPMNWETLTLWILVAIGFATFFFAGFLIWAKCHSK